MILYLDIETLPTSSPEFIAQASASVTAPAQYKKPESIAEWMRDNKEQAVKDIVAKTSFDGLYGSIACICFAFDDGDVHQVNCINGEEKMLRDFYFSVSQVSSIQYVGGSTSIPMVVCGHNVAGFDLPFLKHRSMINGAKPPSLLLKAMNAKPWDNCIADTMLMWSSDSQKRVSMDKLCKAFGLQGKGEFDGSMVADTWPHDPQKVIEYCKDDVRRTREIYKRLTFSNQIDNNEQKAA